MNITNNEYDTNENNNMTALIIVMSLAGLLIAAYYCGKESTI